MTTCSRDFSKCKELGSVIRTGLDGQNLFTFCELMLMASQYAFILLARLCVRGILLHL